MKNSVKQLYSSLKKPKKIEYILQIITSCLYLYNFICFFMTVLGLTVAQGLSSSCEAQASHCGGFSCCTSRVLGPKALVAVAPGL